MNELHKMMIVKQHVEEKLRWINVNCETRQHYENILHHLNVLIDTYSESERAEVE